MLVLFYIISYFRMITILIIFMIIIFVGFIAWYRM